MGLQIKLDAQGGENAPPDGIPEGVVSEQGQVAGAASSGDAWQNRCEQPAHTAPGQFVQVRRACEFQFRRTVELNGKTAQPVGDDEHDF